MIERFPAGEAVGEAAFRVLIQRHGPMVLGICRRILGDEHAAEDAFQATFVVPVVLWGSERGNFKGCDASSLGELYLSE